jgi:serine protease Do
MNKMTFCLAAAGLLLTLGGFGQSNEKGEKVEKGEKGEKIEKKEIIIQKKEGSKNETMKIVIDGETITINGLPADEYTGKQRIIIDEDIIINGNSVVVPGQKGNVRVRGNAASRPLLGVVTETNEKGAKINSVTKESGAEKAGLKAGDILTSINKTAVGNPTELTAAIGKQKAGDEIDITYLRDGKQQKVKATLGRNNDVFTWNNEEFNFNFDAPTALSIPRIQGMDWDKNLQGLMVFNSQPKYGMSIQDDEESRGVKVTEVDEEANAWKGGLRENDIITELDGEKITGVDDLKEKLTTKKENPSIGLKVLRDGKTENLTIRVPRKLKSANL